MFNDVLLRLWRLRTAAKLRLAGWRPGRAVAIVADEKMFPQAERILRSYGGLRFRDERSTIEVSTDRNELAEKELPYYSALLGVPLYTVGFVNYGDTQCLLVDPAGRIYVLYAFRGLELLASSFEIALEYLACGYRINRRIRAKDFERFERAGITSNDFKWPWPGTKPW